MISEVALQRESPQVKAVSREHSTWVEALAKLTQAANAADELAFIDACQQVEWSDAPAGIIVQAVHLALAAGAHRMARILAQQGTNLHPAHFELRQMAHILMAPKVERIQTPASIGVKANRDWLNANGQSYSGRWVALHSGKLLAEAVSLESLAALLDNAKDTNILLMRVN
jgi:hypothetical protein